MTKINWQSKTVLFYSTLILGANLLFAQSEIEVFPLQFTISLNEKEVLADSLMIQNTGTDELTFKIKVEPSESLLKQAMPQSQLSVEEVLRENEQVAAKTTRYFLNKFGSKTSSISHGKINENKAMSWSEIYTKRLGGLTPSNNSIRAAVLRGLGTIDSDIISAWDELNSNWINYGPDDILIDYANLNKDNITYADLVNSGADVIISSCNGWGTEYTLTEPECMAVAQYVNQGHGFIVTGVSFENAYDVSTQMQVQHFAPLVGIDATLAYEINWWGGYEPVHLADPALSLWNGISNPVAAYFSFTLTPTQYISWINTITDGELLAYSLDGVIAVIGKKNSVFHSCLPEIEAPYSGEKEHFQFLYNAILYTAQAAGLPWLSIIPISGIVSPAGKTSVQLTFNAEDVAGGSYRANLIVESNDPVDSTLTLPITMNVTSQPDIAVSQDTLAFGLTYIDYKDTLELQVWNEGHATLLINSIASNSSEFIPLTSTLSVTPLDTQLVKVQFAPSSSGKKQAVLIVNSNDPDEAALQIQLSGIAELAPIISIDPAQISMNLDEGNKQSTTLTISNIGSGLLNFDIQLGTQPPGLMIKSTQEDDDTKIKSAIYSLIQRSGIREHEIRAEGIELTTGKRIDTVCKRPEEIANVQYATIATSADLNVAVLGAEDLYECQDVQSKLLSTNKIRSVSTFDVRYTTPSLIELQAFDAVLVFSNYYYANNALLGNNLADYYDQGGGVVCAMFETGEDNSGFHLGGRWQNNKYYVIERCDQAPWTHRTLGQVFFPNHPIMQGVNTFDGGSDSYCPLLSNLTEGATLIANWSDGKPLVAVKKIGNGNRVDLGFFPVSSNVESGFWQSNTDGALLMANALLYTVGGTLPWCTVDPQSGTTTANNSTQINVTFDASTVDQDSYQGYLLIENNDPVNSKVNIPLSLTVTDNTPPGAITKLKAEGIAATFAAFSWQAPGDNGNQGTAENYEFRYSSQLITESNWSSATSVSDTLPDPAAPGTTQTIRITKLFPDTTYYFALKTKDEANHYSALSNVVELKTPSAVIGLIFLPFEETSGSGALNYQGNEKFNGDLMNFENLNSRDAATNSGWTQFGKQGGALKFDGYDDYVSISDYTGSPLHLNATLTLKASLKCRNDILPSGTLDFYEIISKIDSYSGYALRFNLENGKLRFLIQYGSGSVGIYESNKSSWSGGQWYEIMVTFNYDSPDNNVKIYIDNQLDASYNESRLLTINDHAILIGGGYAYNWQFPGTLDEILIHNRALEPDINHPPAAFSLLYPADREMLDTLNIRFSWQAANDVDAGDHISYTFYLSDDFSFGSIMLEHTLTDTFYTISSGLSADGVYYWKVIAKDDDVAKTECSRIFSFRTSANATGVQKNDIVPKEFKLYQNFPNPFNPITTINYALPKQVYVVISIFNINGHEVKTLLEQEQSPGEYSIVWDGKDNRDKCLPSGLYYYQIKAGEFKKTLKLSLIK
jgi:hypothetical protein